ncbi:MAG: aromatic ring-hydroxylating oxygenase subunit alpha [Acidimicrobiales bacterium]
MDERYAVDPHRALPTSAYRPASHQVDLDAIWHDDWVFVATADQVAAAGDWVAVTVGAQPVIVLRRQDGELAAMSNLCAHRGTLLVDRSGSDKRFQCPYHAWTYSDTGRLLAVPHTRREDVDRDAHCLPTYRAEEWHGLVFVSLNPDVVTLAERLGHLEPLLAEANVDELHHWTADRREEEWRANWKLAISNAMESYHLFKVHPETLEPYSPTAGAYYIVGSADGTATGGESSRGGDDDYLLLSLPPNFVGAITGGTLLWQAVQPLAADRVRVITGGAYPYPSPAASSGLKKWAGNAAAKAAEWAVPDFLPEDKAICERGQRAASGDYRPGPLVPMEQVIVDFHHYLARQLHGADVPDVRTSADVGIPRRSEASAGSP